MAATRAMLLEMSPMARAKRMCRLPKTTAGLVPRGGDDEGDAEGDDFAEGGFLARFSSVVLGLIVGQPCTEETTSPSTPPNNRLSSNERSQSLTNVSRHPCFLVGEPVLVVTYLICCRLKITRDLWTRLAR